MTDSLGSVCCKKDCEGTEFSCACKQCDKKEE